MAYTKIKPVKHHLQRCLDYTSNPKKTEKFSADDLNRLLSYTQNQNKTEHQLYVTGFRCNPATAYRRMYRTKKRWNQPMDEGDILAYRGTDIPAPEGTPILAAHSGTVLVSGWNDSYGNQVLLDNGAGLSTRYAHMTQTAVTAGEAVTAGQIIGYVGSTGDSTGNHLHFEVMQNGVRMNPLELVFAQ